MNRPAAPAKPPAKPPPKPRANESMSEAAKEALTIQALGLRNEQVQARIVHYKGDLETSPELDAVTAQVVQQLKAMQGAMTIEDDGARETAEQREAAHVRTLTKLLTRVFGLEGQSSLVSQNLKVLGRRIAKLFFESELHEKTKGDKEKTIFQPEQGVYYVLQRYKNRIANELEGFEYDRPETKTATIELLAKMEKELQVGFLSRRSPEMKRVMQDYTAVLLDFFQQHLPPRIAQMAKVVIRNAETAEQENSVSYKVHADRFASFRNEWERVFLQQMVNFCGDELISRLSGTSEEIREETVKFFIDPHIFSETCDVICDALYDYLCLEGFLDLPVDWRVKLGRDNA